MQSTERLEEILTDVRRDERTCLAAVKRLEDEGANAAYERGKAYAYSVVANRIDGEIAELRYA